MIPRIRVSLSTLRYAECSVKLKKYFEEITLFFHQLPVRLGARVRRARQLVRRDRHVLRTAAQPGAVLQRRTPVSHLLYFAAIGQHAEPRFQGYLRVFREFC